MSIVVSISLNFVSFLSPVLFTHYPISQPLVRLPPFKLDCLRGLFLSPRQRLTLIKIVSFLRLPNNTITSFHSRIAKRKKRKVLLQRGAFSHSYGYFRFQRSDFSLSFRLRSFFSISYIDTFKSQGFLCHKQSRTNQSHPVDGQLPRIPISAINFRTTILDTNQQIQRESHVSHQHMFTTCRSKSWLYKACPHRSAVHKLRVLLAFI